MPVIFFDPCVLINCLILSFVYYSEVNKFIYIFVYYVCNILRVYLQNSNDLVTVSQQYLLLLCIFIISQFTVQTCCFADGRCLFKQPQSVIYHQNQYDEEISKKCRSVFLSAWNANKKAYSSFIIDSRKIIRISGEMACHPLQGNEAIFSKNYCSKI